MSEATVETSAAVTEETTTDTPLGGFSSGLPPRSKLGQKKSDASKKRASLSHGEQLPFLGAGGSFPSLQELMGSSLPGGDVQPSLLNLFGGQSTDYSKTTAVSNAVKSTKLIRLIMAIIFGLMMTAVISSQQCGYEKLEFLSTYLPSWPLATVAFTDASLIFGAFFISRISNRKKLKTSSSTPSLFSGFGNEANTPGGIGMAGLFDIINRLKKGFSILLAARSLVQSLVLDCSLMLVVLACSHSIWQWYHPNCSQIR